MPDQVLEILIKMQSDLAALKQSTAGLEDLKEKVKQSGAAHEEATRSVHKHAGGHRELHKLMHAVSHESPILGLALRAAFSPIGGLIMVGVVALQQWHHHLEEVKRKSKELAEASKADAKATNDATRSTEEAVYKVAHAYDEWKKALSQAPKTFEDQLHRDIEVLHDVTEAIKKLIVARGELTGDKEGTQRSIDTIERGAEQAELAMIDRAKAQTKEAIKSAMAEADKAEQERTKLLSITPRTVDRKAREDAEAASRGADPLTAMGTLPIIGRFFRRKPDEPIDETTRARREHEVALDVQREQDKAAKASEKAQQKVSELTKSLHDLEAQLDKTKSHFKIQESSRSDLSNLPMAHEALATALGFSGQKKPTKEESQFMQMIAGMANGAPVSGDVAQRMMQAASANQNIQNNLLVRILAFLEQQKANNAQQERMMEARLGALEQSAKGSRGNVNF